MAILGWVYRLAVYIPRKVKGKGKGNLGGTTRICKTMTFDLKSPKTSAQKSFFAPMCTNLLQDAVQGVCVADANSVC